MRDLLPQELADILNRIGQGDDKAFTRLYRHYHGFIYAYLRHRMANEHAAEEVAQDVFMVVFNRPKSFDGRSKFSTWLCGIANHKAADWGRRNGSSMPMAEIDDDTLAAVADPQADFVARLEDAQHTQVIRDCIDLLPEGKRNAVFWAFYEEASMATIAERQDCPVGTVKSRLSYGWRKVMDCVSRALGGHGHD
jgi:RNA polymerase sigma-70 factor (ECF subfamily)